MVFLGRLCLLVGVLVAITTSHAHAGMVFFAQDGDQAQPDARERQKNAAELRYDRCLALIDRAPDRAIDAALAWQTDEPGNVLARHCEALALAKDGEPAEGAARLQLLAEDMERGRGLPRDADGKTVIDPVFIANVWSQAANAFLLADDISRAEETIDRGLTLVDTSEKRAAPLLINRSFIAARIGDYELAYRDLQTVLKADPARRDILLYLASACRQLGYLDEAETNITIYLLDYKTDPTGYLELGNLRAQQGRAVEARQAWLKVLQLAEEGPSVEAASANLRAQALNLDGNPNNDQDQ